MAKQNELDYKVIEYTKQGYVVQHSTEDTVQLYHPPHKTDALGLFLILITLGLWLPVEIYRGLRYHRPKYVYLYRQGNKVKEVKSSESQGRF